MINEILYLDIDTNKNEFEEVADHVIDSQNSSSPCAYSYEVTEQTTRAHKTLYEITFTEKDGSDVSETSLYCTKHGNTGMRFERLKLTSKAHGFYTNIETQSISEIMDNLLSTLAIKNNGTYVISYDDGVGTAIVEGKSCKAVNGIVAGGRVFTKDGSQENYDDDDSSDLKSYMDIKYPINEWTKSHSEVLDDVKKEKGGINKKMDQVGKHLIEKKLSDEIDVEEFIDVFRQAYAIGFTDKTMIMIAKLMM